MGREVQKKQLDILVGGSGAAATTRGVAAGAGGYAAGRDNITINIEQLTLAYNKQNPEEFSKPEVQESVKSTLKNFLPQLTGLISKDTQIDIDTNAHALLDAIKEKESQGAVRDSEILVTLGNAALISFKFVEAMQYYDKAIKINPRNAEAWSGKGTALANLKRSNEAISCYDKAIEVNPRYAGVWFSKGNTFIDLGRYNEAILSLHKFIELAPPQDAIYVERAKQLINGLVAQTLSTAVFNAQNLFGVWSIVGMTLQGPVNTRITFYQNGTFSESGVLGGMPMARNGLYSFDPQGKVIQLIMPGMPQSVILSITNIQGTTFMVISPWNETLTFTKIG